MNYKSLKQLDKYVDNILNFNDVSIFLNSLSEMKNNLRTLTACEYIDNDSLEYQIMNDYISKFIRLIEKPNKDINDMLDIYFLYNHSNITFESIKENHKKLQCKSNDIEISQSFN